jgi:hypothetical protein
MTCYFLPEIALSSMRRIVFLLLASLFLSISGSAQAPASMNDRELGALIDQIRAQDQQIAGNQTKIDQRLAEITEAVRQARIFAGRGK